MPRVVGTDPGTSSLDLLLLVEGRVAEQARLAPAEPDHARRLAELLTGWSPIDLLAGPSGYGLPLVPGDAIDDRQLDLMALVRPDERGAGRGVLGFRGWVRAILDAGVPSVFLPGGVHLPTIPDHRKLNAIDLGTADKVAVAALALRRDCERTGQPLDHATFAVVEIGSAFTAVLVVERGQLVDAAAGTRGRSASGAAGCGMANWRMPSRRCRRTISSGVG